MAIKTSLLTIPFVFLFACGGESVVGPGGPDDSPGGGGDVETATRVAGTYEVTSSFDLTTSNALPPIVSDVVLPLSQFSENPTGTIIDLIKVANTPISPLLNSIPSGLLGLFENTMNNLIEDKLYNNVPILETIASYADVAATIVTDFDVVTTLQVGNVDDAGNANATHSLAGFAFDNNGTRVFIDTPELLDTLTVARDVSVNVSLEGSANTIDIGSHSMGLPIGDFAVLGLNAAIQAKTEYDDLGGLLGGLVDCPGIAANIGDLCLSFVCFANESQISGICETGLDLVAQQVESRLSSIGDAEIVMMGGQAQVIVGSKSDSASGDSVNAMQSGSWDTEFGLGSYSLPLQSAFEARRVD